MYGISSEPMLKSRPPMPEATTDPFARLFFPRTKFPVKVQKIRC
jgi:hypothetical protein